MVGEVSTLLITRDHLIHGDVDMAERRLLEVVNDSSTNYLRVRSAAVFRRECNSLVAQASDVVVPKNSLALLAPATDRHEAPQKRRDNFTAKRKSDAFVIVPGYEIFGKLYLNGVDDPVVALTHELGAFFPIADAEVCWSGAPRGGVALPVVIVNSAFISLLRIGNFTRPGPGPSASRDEQLVLSS